jgi:hypothetical protein
MAGSIVLTYKLYVLDPKDRIAGPPHILQAECDEQAIVMARRYLDTATLELWQDARRVTTLKPPG